MGEKIGFGPGLVGIESGEKGFDLKHFLVKPKTDYRALVEAEYLEHGHEIEKWDEESLFTEFGELLAKGRLRKSDYSSPYRKIAEQELKIFKERLKGKVLVNLGSGPDLYTSKLASELGVGTMINVDKFRYSDAALDPTVNLADPRWKELFPQMDMLRVRADMLDFISRVPNDSACVTISGIDKNIITSPDYHRALAKEIVRVMPPGGIVFGNNSRCLEILEEGAGRRGIRPLMVQDSGFTILEKVTKKT